MRASRRATAIVAPTTLAIAVALALAATTTADVTTRIATLPCVVDANGKPSVPIVGSGFTPGGLVRISYLHQKLATPALATTVRADPLGAIAAVAVPAPFATPATVQQSYGMIAEDQTDQTLTAQTKFRQVRFGITVTPSSGSPDRLVTYVVRGFPLNHAVYGHFRLGGRTIRTVKIGTAAPDCGTASRRMRLIPATIRAGTWQLYFDEARSYSPKTEPQFHASIGVRRSGA